MFIINSKKELNNYIKNKYGNRKVGFIPTMGSLHLGHLSLINKAKDKDCLICSSIFVNPRQFSDTKDYKAYPRSLSQDIDLLKKNNCNMVFIPSEKEIYSSLNKKRIRIKKYRKILCDKYRIGHFEGVLDIIDILFNLLKPNFVFFGEKDFQQLKIIEEYIKLNNLKIKLIPCPSIRDKNGMSLSSRYNKFTNKQKNKFNKISQILKRIINNINKLSIKKSLTLLRNEIKQIGIKKIDYIEIRESKSLKITKIKKGARLFIAFYIDDIRIIDNFKL